MCFNNSNKLLKHIFLRKILSYFLFLIACILFVTDIHLLYAENINNNEIISAKKWSEMTSSEKKIVIKEKVRKIKQRRLEEQINKVDKEEAILVLKKKLKQIAQEKRKNIEKELVLQSAPEFPEDLDISNNLKYKRIQERALSCELSAASDILSYLDNKKISESYVISVMDKSYYNSYPIEKNWKIIWWNPNAWYVWYIDKTDVNTTAKQAKLTWYGVLEKPIAKIYNRHGYKTKIITNKNYSDNYNTKSHLTEVLKNLVDWNMIQLWWDYCTNPDYEDTQHKNNCKLFSENRSLEWYYEEDWKLIKHEWLNGEHAFYLLGYKWWIMNPTEIIVWDTMTGKHIYPISEWMRKWDKMQNRSLIVYAK